MQGDYLKKSQLAKEYGLCRQTIYKIVDGIQEQIGKGRYSRYAIADGLVNRYVFIDYLTYGKMLRDKNMSKCVPAFRPSEIMELVRENYGR
ncbi:MAG: hypothetical protein KBT03_12020 [Bacteroidales bacterium]|nr:hypothetical protein [Candidatus Scybalousia scybalohippi]